MKYLLQAVFFICFLGNFMPHPVHVSITDMNYNADEKTLESSIKLFRDDLNDHLKTISGKDYKLNTDKPLKSADTAIANYIANHLMLKINAKNAAFSMVGYTLEEESIWVHVQTRAPKNTKLIAITNTLLMDAFEDQMNLVNLKWNANAFSLAFKKGQETQARAIH